MYFHFEAKIFLIQRILGLRTITLLVRVKNIIFIELFNGRWRQFKGLN